MAAEIRLTSLAHGGGCGCKLAPSVLHEILAKMPVVSSPELLVGTETGDDAAVYRLSDNQALVATTDFFMPIVDDPFLFGQIAATNALSDVYAMGGRPILALAILGIPLGQIELGTVQTIVAGGAHACAVAGVPVAGGHSIDSPEPIYGLAVSGLVHPDRLLRNCAARAGDELILTKAIGIGIYSAALKRGLLTADLYDAMINSTTQLNAVGALLPDINGVHAVTDVTGFGLLGHLLEMCRGSALAAELWMDAVPLLPSVAALAHDKVGTGAATRNWASYGSIVRFEAADPGGAQALLCDPQTSGGLLISAAPAAVTQVLALLKAQGFSAAKAVGRLVAGEPRIIVR
jgi:selenide,water dikinase